MCCYLMICLSSLEEGGNKKVFLMHTTVDQTIFTWKRPVIWAIQGHKRGKNVSVQKLVKHILKLSSAATHQLPEHFFFANLSIMTQDTHSLRHFHFEEDIMNVIQSCSQLWERRNTYEMQWQWKPVWCNRVILWTGRPGFEFPPSHDTHWIILG